MISFRLLTSIPTVSRFYYLILCACLCLSNNVVAIEAEPSSSMAHSEPTAVIDYHNTDFEQLLAEFKNKLPNEIFQAANQALTHREYKTAIQIYSILNSLHPFNEYTEQAHAHTIEAYYSEFDIDNVTREASKFITLYPNSQYLEKVYYLSASVYFKPQNSRARFLYKLFKFAKLDPAHAININELAKAMDDFFKFLQHFPNGVYSFKAQQAIEEIKQLMARREYYIASFYFKARNYVAAYNRIVNLLEHYPEINAVLSKKYIATLDKQYHEARRELGLDSGLCSLQ